MLIPEHMHKCPRMSLFRSACVLIYMYICIIPTFIHMHLYAHICIHVCTVSTL